jgi:protein ImuB
MFACLYAPGNLVLLLECARHFSPLIEETSPDAVMFDIRGLGRIYGEPEQIADAIQRRVGIPANLALAVNPDAAVHAARGLAGVTILAPGREAAVLATLPLYLLGGSPEFARNLDLWGIRTFGEFAALPPLGVAARLGEEGSHLQRLASGAGDRQLRLRVDPLVFREERELEDAIDLLEPLLFVLSQMLRDLCERLRFHGKAANEVCLRLKLERAADHKTSLSLPVPTLNAKVLLKLLQLELNERPPQSPVERIYLELAPVEPRTTQHGLFLPLAPEPEKLEITLARIRGLVGEANVGAPEILDTHRPDAFRMITLTRFKSTRGAPEARLPLHPRLALRRFRPPRPAQVWCTDQGKPVRVFSSAGGGAVCASAGPWHRSGDWWAQDAWDRQEWDVEISNQGVFRISRDCLRGLWLMDGNYD